MWHLIVAMMCSVAVGGASRERSVQLTLYVPRSPVGLSSGVPAVLEVTNKSSRTVRFIGSPIYKSANDPHPAQEPNRNRSSTTRPDIDESIQRDFADVSGLVITSSGNVRDGMSYVPIQDQGMVPILKVDPGESHLLKIRVPALKLSPGKTMIQATMVNHDETVAESLPVEITVAGEILPTTNPK